MLAISVKSVLARVHKYLKNDITSPFLVVVDDGAEYSEIVSGLDMLALMRVSDFCANNDAYPDVDALCHGLSVTQRRTLLLGFGESTLLSGNENAIGKIKDLSFDAKVVIVCRGIRMMVNRLCADDKKFNSRRVCFLKYSPSYEIVRILPSLGIFAIDGFKELLVRLENGAGQTLLVRTSLPLRNVRVIDSAYEAIRLANSTFMAQQTCLSDAFWAEYLIDKNLQGFDLFHWRSFLQLKLESSTNEYLRYVAETSFSYDKYKRQIFSALLDFSVNDKRFSTLYNTRKVLLKDVKNCDVAEYIAETKVKDKDRFFYLTDNTTAEQQAIIESLNGETTLPDALKNIYPAMYEYLSDYTFAGDKGKLLTNYFTEYKKLKLTNRITPEFCQKVQDLAVDGSRPYNGLRTRGDVLDSLQKTNTFLYWIDALGVEYLGYIQSRAKALELKITIHIVRANLPSITSFNNDFYDTWNADKGQTKELDKVKHDGEHDFNYQTIKTPVHLAEELRIVDEALVWAKTKLTGKKADKVIFAADHGASRLAVIYEQECKWEMALKGKHCGRCCPCSDADVKSEYATLENNFWVLANYDRFKGGRKGSVEVHGGATLEEVVIPLIEITLFGNKIEINNTTPVTTASYVKAAEIILFSKNRLKAVSVQVLGQHYQAEAIDDNKHKVVFHDIKRAGEYTADVFAGDNLISSVKFRVEPESGKINDSDWFNGGKH